MKRTVVLTAIFTLLLAAAISAQEKTTNFAGSWDLDASKSKLDERMRVQSITMNVEQTDTELKIQNTINRAAFLDGNMLNNGAVNRVEGGATSHGGGSGDGTVIYNLKGDVISAELTRPNADAARTERDRGMSGSATFKAEFMPEGKLKLTNVRNFSLPMGNRTITTTVTEIWELADGGKTLKILRQTETPRGTSGAELVFTKKDSTSVSDNQTTTGGTTPAPANQMPKQVSGGIVNGKATNLVKPIYPDEAKAAQASGAVHVQVTIDERGNVVSAQAISGDALLRAASEDAARASKFLPTLLKGVPVKVTGVIVYNFAP